MSVQHYSPGDLLDVGWFGGFLAIALGANAAQVCGLPLRDARAASPTLPSLLAPLLPVLVALGVATANLHRGVRPDFAAASMVCALVLLALARQTLLLWDFVAAGRSGQHGSAMNRLAHAALGSALVEAAAPAPSPVRPTDGVRA